MADTTASASTTGPSKTPTPAQRIAELNAIDRSVSGLLEAASEAVGILANKRDEKTPFATLEAQQARFAKAADTYFSTLSSIEVGLRRQVYALEEAGLVQEGQEKDARRAKSSEGGFETATGGGPLDPSWLNARADKGIEYKLERELVDQAKEFLESTGNKKADGDDT